MTFLSVIYSFIFQVRSESSLAFRWNERRGGPGFVPLPQSAPCRAPRHLLLYGDRVGGKEPRAGGGRGKTWDALVCCLVLGQHRGCPQRDCCVIRIMYVRGQETPQMSSLLSGLSEFWGSMVRSAQRTAAGEDSSHGTVRRDALPEAG